MILYECKKYQRMLAQTELFKETYVYTYKFFILSARLCHVVNANVKENIVDSQKKVTNAERNKLAKAFRDTEVKVIILIEEK